MEFKHSWRDRSATQLHLQLQGKLQYGSFGNLQSFIFNLKQNPPKEISFDLTDVDLIDSSGLGLLIVADEITGNQRKVTLQHPSKQVEQLLDVCKIDKIMDIVL